MNLSTATIWRQQKRPGGHPHGQDGGCEAWPGAERNEGTDSTTETQCGCGALKPLALIETWRRMQQQRRMAESQHQSPLVLSLQERQSRRWRLQVREYTAWYADNSARKSDGHGGFTARMMDDRHARERHIPTTLMEVHSAKHSVLPVINATALWPRAASPLIGTRGSVCTESLPPMGRLCGDRCEGRLYLLPVFVEQA